MEQHDAHLQHNKSHDRIAESLSFAARFSNLSPVNDSRRACGGELLFAFLSGTLLAVSFPKFYQAWLAWLAPGFILLAVHGSSPRQIIWKGLIAGFGNYLVSLSWMLATPSLIKAFVGYLVVCAIQSGYLAIWCCVCWALLARRSGPVDPAIPPLVAQFKTLSLRQRIAWPFFCAAAWVAMEMCRARFFIGFPWNFLGVSQFEKASLIQTSSLTGVYGVSFLLAWVSVSLLAAALMLRGGLRFILRALVQVAMPAVAIVGALYYGSGRLEESDAGLLTLRIALIQPSFSARTLQGADKSPEPTTKLVELTQASLKFQPDLIVTPELAAPYKATLQSVAGLARTEHLWLVAGVRWTPLDTNFFDGAVLLDPNGPIAGEPIQSYRPRVVQLLGDFLPAINFVRKETNTVFEIQKPRVRFTPMASGEDLLPQEARRRTGDDVDFLLHLRGEADIGASPAQWQHAANAVFRSIENGLPMVRSANKGLSCWIDSRGRIHDAYFDNSDDVHQTGVKIVEVPLYGAAPSHPATLYHRHGDWFGWGCVGVVGVALVLRAVGRPKSG